MTINMPARHVVVGLVILVLTGVTAAGFLGPAVGRERIASYDVTATIRDDRTVAVREVIDWDFGGQSRRGIFRLVPGDGGRPQEIEVESPTAPDQFTVRLLGPDTEIKVGDPDTTIRGRHRYVITYVLARTIVDDRFALDAIGDRFDVPVDRAAVAVIGADLDRPRCFRGPAGSTTTCPIGSEDGAIRASIDGLDAHEGVTIDGTVGATRAVDRPALPPFVGRDASARVRWATIVGGLALLMGLALFVICRQVGRNEVAAGGATEAAFGPGPTTFADPAPPRGDTRLVADTQMGELAGLEFVPPDDVEPWQAAVVLRETVDDRIVGAWFASLAAHDVLTLSPEPAGVVLRPGPRAAQADSATAPILNRAMAGRSEITLGTYDLAFARAWKEARHAIGLWVPISQVFRRRPPGPRAATGRGLVAGLTGCAAIPIVAVLGAAVTSAVGLRSAVAAVLITLGVSGAAGWVAYGSLTRSLSARGSAIALRTESFRRFLHDSEAQHVEWAWQNGLLREYSAWAVALGEANAWNRAMAASSVPPPEQTRTSAVMSPVLLSSSFHSAHTAPSSSGSSGGGFSGGGSVGGGGGGGGGGSW